jgi:hypothetical protein
VGLIGGIGIRMIEQAEMILRSEYGADKIIELRRGELALDEERLHVLEVGSAAHIHIDASRSTAECRVGGVLGEALWDEVADSEGVADDESFEA